MSKAGLKTAGLTIGACSLWYPSLVFHDLLWNPEEITKKGSSQEVKMFLKCRHTHPDPAHLLTNPFLCTSSDNTLIGPSESIQEECGSHVFSQHIFPACPISPITSIWRQWTTEKENKMPLQLATQSALILMGEGQLIQTTLHALFKHYKMFKWHVEGQRDGNAHTPPRIIGKWHPKRGNTYVPLFFLHVFVREV